MSVSPDCFSAWFDYRDLYDSIADELAAKNGAVFVELGCLQGASLRHMAAARESRGGRFNIVGVDIWSLSPGDNSFMRQFAHVDMYATCCHNLRGHDVQLMRMPSVYAAHQFADESVDAVFVDAAHDYASVREDLASWLPKLRRGGLIAGHDWFTHPEVSCGVADIIRLDEIKFVGGCWTFRNEFNDADYGEWAVPLPDDVVTPIFIPVVNDLPRLRAAVDSLGDDRRSVVVIDQSREGCDIPGVSVFRWTSEAKFTRVMNFMLLWSRWNRKARYGFMHSDGLANSFRMLEDKANELDARCHRWGAIFSNYDVLSLFNVTAASHVGVWDETFTWYVADMDYYGRMRFLNWPIVDVPGACAGHAGSNTLRAMSPDERATVNANHDWARSHYRHKWGAHWTDRRRHRCPYGHVNPG